jgi:hypothetical protein
MKGTAGKHAQANTPLANMLTPTRRGRCPRRETKPPVHDTKNGIFEFSSSDYFH